MPYLYEGTTRGRRGDDEGTTLATVDEGVANAEQIGVGELIARGEAAAEALPPEMVYAGFSLALPAQKLAQTRPGARGG